MVHFHVCICLCLWRFLGNQERHRLLGKGRDSGSSGSTARSDGQGRRARSLGCVRMGHTPADFASMLYFGRFPLSCCVWQRSSLAFDKQLLPNVSEETCQVLQLGFHHRQKNRQPEKPWATEPRPGGPAPMRQGTRSGQVLSLKVEDRVPAALGSTPRPRSRRTCWFSEREA